MLIESVTDGVAEGRAAHQGPEVDGTTIVRGTSLEVGDLVTAEVVGADGVDLVAAAVAPVGARQSAVVG